MNICGSFLRNLSNLCFYQVALNVVEVIKLMFTKLIKRLNVDINSDKLFYFRSLISIVIFLLVGIIIIFVVSKIEPS